MAASTWRACSTCRIGILATGLSSKNSRPINWSIRAMPKEPRRSSERSRSSIKTVSSAAAAERGGGQVMRSALCGAMALVALAAVAPENAQAQAKIVVGSVPGIAAAGTYIADAKGYFRDAGIDVSIADLASAADAMASLATNQFQVVEGGYSAGYWNALAKDFPIITAFDQSQDRRAAQHEGYDQDCRGSEGALHRGQCARLAYHLRARQDARTLGA